MLEVKQVGTPEKARHVLILSDGVHYQQGMLASQLNELVTSGKLTKFCLVRLTEHVKNVVKGRELIIVLKVDVVDQCESAIGSPANLDAATTPGAAAPTISAPAPAPAPAAPVTTSTAYNQPAAQQAAPNAYAQAARVGGGVQANASHHNVVDIQQLNMYMNKWTIKARVTNKSDWRTWDNGKTKGKLFSVDLLDQSGGEIRATMFNQTAERLHEVFQKDRVFYISKGQIKLANKKFNKLNSEYEITLNDDVMVEPADDDQSIPKITFNFVAIADIANTEPDSNVDVLGIVTDPGTLNSIVPRNRPDSTLNKRDLTLMDQSDGGKTIRLTLWGEQAEAFDESLAKPVLAIKGARVSDYDGRSLSSSRGSMMEINPIDLPEAAGLRTWYDTVGSGVKPSTLSVRTGGGGGGNAPVKPLSAVRDENMGMDGTMTTFKAKVTVTNIKPDANNWYPSCQGTDCKKKVFQEGDDQWMCEKCKRTYPNRINRYVLNMGINDPTGQVYATAFDDQGNQIIGASADDMEEYKENNRAMLEEKYHDAQFTMWNLVLKAKGEAYQGETKVRVSIVAAEPVDFIADSRSLIKSIQAAA